MEKEEVAVKMESMSSCDAELLFLACSLLRRYGLKEAAEAAWERATSSSSSSDSQHPPQLLSLLQPHAGLSISVPTSSQRLPPPPYPSLTDDALRVMVSALLPAAASASATASSSSSSTSLLPASLLHCGSQALLPHFRCHPLRLNWRGQQLSAFHAVRDAGWLRRGEESQSAREAVVRRCLSLRYRCLSLCYGHLAAVYSAVFDSTGDVCATAGDDHLVKLWSARTGRLLMTLRGHSAELTDIAISPDNELLASASWDQSIRVWSLRNDGEPHAVFFHHHSNRIWRIAFHPLYSAPHSRFLLSASTDGSTQVFSIDQPDRPSLTLFAHPLHLHLPDTLTALTAAEAERGGYLAALTPTLTFNRERRQADGTVPRDALPLMQIAMRQTHAAAAAASAAPVLAAVAALPVPTAAAVAAAAASVSVQGSAASASAAPSPEMLCITHHPDGSEFALGSNDHSIRVYSWQRAGPLQQLVAVLKGHAGEIDHITYDHTGDRLLSLDDTGEGLLWERVSPALLQRLVDEERQTAATTASASSSSTPSPPLTRFHCIGRLRVLSPSPLSSSLSPSAEEATAAAFSLAASAVHRPPAVKLTAGFFSLDDRFVLTTSADSLLRRWEAPQRGAGDALFLSHYLRLRKQQPARPPLLFTNRRAFVLRVPLLLPLPFPARHTGEVPVLRVHPSVPSLVLTAAHDGRVCFWDAEQRCLLRCIRQPDSHWIDGSFSPAGDSVALTSEEGRLALLGLHSRILTSLTPGEQFFLTDYHPLTRDDSGYVVDANSQTPPHLHPARHVLIHADGSVFDPQPRMDAAPDRSIPAPQPQTRSARAEAQPAVAADAVMAADLARVRRLAELRVERRLRWQSRQLTVRDAHTVQAAAYRRRSGARGQSGDHEEEPASLQLSGAGQQQQQRQQGSTDAVDDGGEPDCGTEDDSCGWWQERREPDGQWAVDVEDDVAEQTLDGDGDAWTEEDAAQLPQHQPVSSSLPVSASAAHRAADDGGDGSASVAEWLHAQHALEAEMEAEAEREQREEVDDDWTRVTRSSSGRVTGLTIVNSSSAVPEPDAVDSSRAGRAERRAATRQRSMSSAAVRTEAAEEKREAPVFGTEPIVVEDDEDTSLLVRARRGRERRTAPARRRSRPGSSSGSASARRRVVQYYRDDDDDWDVEEDEVQDDDDRDGQEWQEDEQRADEDEDEDEDGEEDQDDTEARSAALSYSERRAARGLRPMPVRSVRLRERVEPQAPAGRAATRAISRAGSGLSTNSSSSSVSSREARAARAKRRRGEADVPMQEEQTETETETAALWADWKQEEAEGSGDGVLYTLVEGMERSEGDADAALVIKLRRSVRGGAALDRQRDWEQKQQPLRRRGVVRFKLEGQEMASLSLQPATQQDINGDQSSSSSSSSSMSDATQEAAAAALEVMEADEQTQQMLIS